MESPQGAGSLSLASLTCLSRAGWHAGRRIDPAPLVDANARAGIETPVAAREFYSSVGELDVRYPLDAEYTALFRLVAQRAEDPNALYGAERFGAIVGSALTVIGIADNRHQTLYMSREGEVFGGMDDTLLKYGRSWPNAVNCLCEGRKFVQVPVPAEEIPAANGSIVLSPEALRMIRKAGVGLGQFTVDDRGDFRLELARLPVRPKELRVPLGPGARGDRGALVLSRRADAPASALEFWERDLQTRVEPIGDFNGMVVFAAADGRVYAGLPEGPSYFLFFGASLSDAINRLAPGGEGAIQM